MTSENFMCKTKQIENYKINIWRKYQEFDFELQQN